MEQVRKPFQGIWNIVRFNWHFYLFAFGLALLVLSVKSSLNINFRLYAGIALLLILLPTLFSLVISYYVYDLSDLYKQKWLENIKTTENSKIMNINAGFDETSMLLKSKFKNSELTVFDFYDPARHTEVSIKRARKAYPPFPDIQQISVSCIPLPDHSTNLIFAFLSAHEIRDVQERGELFKELCRVLKPSGQIVVVEHVRDMANFLAYNLGFFHFHSRASWLRTFQQAKLTVAQEIKITPFITAFILEKNGISL